LEDPPLAAERAAIVIPTDSQERHRRWWNAVNSRRPDWPGERVDSETALTLIGVTGVHPDDVVATRHATRTTVLLTARANREAYGHPTLGAIKDAGRGWVVVLDLRPALAELGCPITAGAAMTSHRPPRLFTLRRNVDISGASGTGVVADGVLWPDGSASVRWRGNDPSVAFWADFGSVERIHGHGGATRVVWADTADPDADQQADDLAEPLQPYTVVACGCRDVYVRTPDSDPAWTEIGRDGRHRRIAWSAVTAAHGGFGHHLTVLRDRAPLSEER
jgi:hypothetical protein